MKFLSSFAAACLLVSVSCAPAPAPAEEPPDTSAEDRAAIEAMVEPYVAAYNAKDIESVLAFYDDQVVTMPANAPAGVGIGSVRANLETLFEQGDVEIAISPVELIVSGDIAVGRGNYTLKVTPEDGDAVEENGKYLSLWSKLPDGSWKISRVMTNSNIPLEQE